jgi:flavin reductase (DIM6/NTAB) family NADH-FMN oxidoreductase RutF
MTLSAAARSMESTLTSHFRTAMRGVASSVFLLSTRGPEGNAGMTATSVCSLSLDPASVLICVNRSNSFMRALEASGRFALNILSRDDETVARAFGSPTGRENRFVLGDWYELGGMPALKSSLSAIVCDVAGRMDFGSHRVFVGQVRQIDNHNGGAELVYCQGAFRTLHREPKHSVL